MLHPAAVRNGRLFLHAGGSLTSALGDAAKFLGHAQRAVFLPYALHDYEHYTALMRPQFDAMGVKLTGLHTFADPVAALASADAIVVGGGNSFRLVKALHDIGLIEPVRRAVEGGIPYWGASAGSNVACPTIRTTNDMPIVEPRSLRALALVPFQINPHYVDEPLANDEVKETREYRIREFLEENDVTVVGLREESWLIANGHTIRLHGPAGALLFRRGRPPQALEPRDDLSFLLSETSNFDAPLRRVVDRWSVSAD